MNTKSGIYFIVSNLEISGEIPFEIIPGHTLRKARDLEIQKIDHLIEIALRNRALLWIPYDGLYHQVPTESGGTTLSRTLLPKENWKYWVIAYNGYNYRQFDIMRAALLLPFDFQIGTKILFSDENQNGQIVGYSYIQDHLVEKCNDWDVVCMSPTKIDSKELYRIGEIICLISELKEKNQEISNHFLTAISRFEEVMKVGRKTDLIIVGLFALIEFLITHKPRLNENLDSITHQIINKIVLLRKRYSRQIVTDKYFSKATEETIWKKLYAYRSSIAHGSGFQFNKDGVMLKNKYNVIEFLEENIKELLLLLLKEPDLVFDIRGC